jgi:anaerobic selenocysteine-containing dehydrogenase
VPPRFERKEQWWILSRIEQAMGFDSVLNEEHHDPYGRINKMLSYAELSIDKLKALPRGTAVLPKSVPGRFFSDWIQTPDKKIDCCPGIFTEAIETAERIFQELENEPENQVKLISLRNGFMHNSWYQNLEKLKKGEHRSNPVYLNSRDAGKRGLATGARVRMFNPWGAVEAIVKIDDRLRDGVAAMAHGWGNQNTPGMKIAHQYPGVNVNQLLPCGPGSYEKLSNQAHMTGIAVSLEKK